MKLKNVKRYFKQKIHSGWREYLPICIHKKYFGFGNKELPTIDNIENCLDLKFLVESDLLGRYVMYDPKESTDNLKMAVILNLCSEPIRNNNVEYTLDYIVNTEYIDDSDSSGCNVNIAYKIHNNRIFYIEYSKGLLHPSYAKDSNYDFWKNPEDIEFGVFGDSDGETYVTDLLDMFITLEQIKDSLYSEDELIKFIRGETYDSINELTSNLAKLEKYTKVIYYDCHKDFVTITFGIRYPCYIDSFLSELKRLIKKHKDVKIR
ncbi:MAG: hypothetical protein ACRDD8_11305 [Bacteroidales bacterium]